MKKVGYIKRDEDGFPQKLLEVRPVVKEFWYRGELDKEIFRRTVAVVGSRKMSRYGKQVLGEIVPRLVVAGYSVVSGLMYGVDQEAHKQVLLNGGTAIGVLGYGITYRSEEGAMQMANEVVETGGVVMSEYEGESVSQRWMFPQRNRIVMGLADFLIVIEGAEKSGTMDTVRRGVKAKKEIYAVPGSVFSPTSVGTNMLIANGVARALTLETLSELTGASFGGDKGEMKGVGLVGNELEVWTILKTDGPSGVNELTRKLRQAMGMTLATLSGLQMRGIVKEEKGIWRIT